MLKNKDIVYFCPKCLGQGYVWDNLNQYWKCLFCGEEEKEQADTISLKELNIKLNQGIKNG